MNTILLKINQLGFSYGDNPIIQNFSHEISPGNLIHLCGDNGSGKSTLLKLLAGILIPDQGSILGEAAKAFVGHSLGMHPELSIYQNLSLGFQSFDHHQLDILLAETELTRKKHQALKTLSKGEGQKTALIAAILQQPQLWLIDEPFANLDQTAERWLWRKMQDALHAGVAIVFTAHQRHFLHQEVITWQL